jgi:predicted ferric reductase
VEVAVKALGDFTSTVGELAPGTTVYVDGPHGVLSIDYDEGSGFGLVAGGVGIAGLISTLRAMADRNDARPVVQFYANGEWEGVAFREELEEPPGYQRFQFFNLRPGSDDGRGGGGARRARRAGRARPHRALRHGVSRTACATYR